jgi:hypothetical protein
MPKHVTLKIKNCITTTPGILILLLLDGKITHCQYESYFKHFHDVAEPMTTTTTPSTPVPRDATVYVQQNNVVVSICIRFLVFCNSVSNSDTGHCNIQSNRQITITRPGSATCKKMERV